MKNYFLFLLGLVGLLFSACAPDVSYRDISTFTIQENSLANKEKVTLMYVSATPSNEEALSYFVHAVGVSETNGDTINILTPYSRGGGGGDSKNEFQYFTPNSAEGIKYFEENFETGNIEELKNITRVSFDKRFNYIAQNNYPTVIGFLEK